MKKIITMALTFIILISQINVLGVQAKESVASESLNEKATPSGIAYDDLENEINAFIEEREEGTASVSMAVFENQNTIYEIQHGFANIDAGLKVDSDTVYEWGSVTKMLVWASVMQLYEQGRIDLDEDIRTYLPEGFLTKLSYDSPITMTNLMNHNAGWQETTYDVEVQDASKIVDLETALRQTEPAQIYEPGEVCAYSNWGASLAAYIVECIMGQDFGDYVEENVFEPLGMEHTSLAPDCSDNIWVQEQRKRLNCYYITTDTYEDYGLSIRYILLYPAGAATGTLEDFITFAKAFVPEENKNSPLFQKNETLDLMLSATSYYGDSDIARNSHGLWTLQYTVDIVGHNGNTSGCTSTLMFQPKSGLGVVVMTNEVGETAYNYGFLSLIFGDYDENESIAQRGITRYTDISGIYTLSRTHEKGFPALYKYIGALMPLSKTEGKGVFKLSVGQGTLTQVADNQYIMDNENGYRYLMYQTVNEDGQIVLQMMGSDVIKQNTVTFWLKIALLLLMVIAVFYSIITCIVKLIALLIRKFRKKEVSGEETSILKRFQIITLLVNALIGILCYNLVIKPLDGGSVEYVQVMIQCIVLGLLSVVPVMNVVLLIKNGEIGGKKRKIKYIITAVFGCVLTFGIWYWQLFNFWSC